MREFDVASLGPRFADLMKELKPNAQSGFYFYANAKSAEPLSYSYFQHMFTEAKIAAGLSQIRPHDLRGSFAVHRAMVIKNFRQLQIEMGHGNSRSIESYLARAQRFDPSESIFWNPAATKIAGQDRARLSAENGFESSAQPDPIFH